MGFGGVGEDEEGAYREAKRADAPPDQVHRHVSPSLEPRARIALCGAVWKCRWDMMTMPVGYGPGRRKTRIQHGGTEGYGGHGGRFLASPKAKPRKTGETTWWGGTEVGQGPPPGSVPYAVGFEWRLASR